MTHLWVIWYGPDGKIGESGPFVEVRLRFGELDGLRPVEVHKEEWWPIGYSRHGEWWQPADDFPMATEFRVESRPASQEEATQ